jgi:hypothetical protein
MIGDIVTWANQNAGFISMLGLLVIVVLSPFGLWFLNRVEGAVTRVRTDEEIRKAEVIRREMHEKITWIDPASDYGPVLIRDVARDHLYFDGDDGKFAKRTPPPSFRATLVGLSVHGVRVYAGFPTRIKMVGDQTTWCLADADDPNSVVAHPIGVIPFMSIVCVNWHGDPACTFPHVFCRFDGTRGWPYKVVEFCEKGQMSEGWNLYRPLVDSERIIDQKF